MIVDLTISILGLGKLYGAKSRPNNRTPVQQYSLYNDENLAIQSQHFSRYNDIINIINHKRVRTTTKMWMDMMLCLDCCICNSLTHCNYCK